MQHIISYTDLNGFTSEVILASSTKEHKKLVVRITTFKTIITTEYVLYQNDVQVELPVNELWCATKEYNRLK